MEAWPSLAQPLQTAPTRTQMGQGAQGRFPGTRPQEYSWTQRYDVTGAAVVAAVDVAAMAATAKVRRSSTVGSTTTNGSG